jgi:hypothetical protein
VAEEDLRAILAEFDDGDPFAFETPAPRARSITPPPFTVEPVPRAAPRPPTDRPRVTTPPPLPVDRPRVTTPPPLPVDRPRVTTTPPLPPDRPRATTPPPLPVEPPRAATPAPLPVEKSRATPATPPREVVPGMSTAELRALHERYAAARKSTGEADVPFDKMLARLARQVPDLLSRHKVARVGFDVAIKEGKVILRATPKRDEPKK